MEVKLSPEDVRAIAEQLRPLVAEMVRESMCVDDRGRLAYPEAEAAQRLGITTDSLRSLRRENSVRYFRLGRRVFYSADVLKELECYGEKTA